MMQTQTVVSSVWGLLFLASFAAAASNPITGLYLSSDPICPSGFVSAATDSSLKDHPYNINLATLFSWFEWLFAPPKAIFLCLTGEASLGPPITNLKLLQSRDSGDDDWLAVPHSPDLSGNLNQNTFFGKPIFLFYTTRSTLDEAPLTNLRLTVDAPSDSRTPQRQHGLSGNLNQHAWFVDTEIYLEFFRMNEPQSNLVNENSLPTLTSYAFDPYPSPVYSTNQGCLFFGLFCVMNVGPCWHTQQLATFADADNLYTFSTVSDATYGQAYLLSVPLLEAGSTASQPSVSDAGRVAWFEETTEFNHPGDLAVHGRIILTAGQNWDPTPEDTPIGFLVYAGGLRLRVRLGIAATSAGTVGFYRFVDGAPETRD